MALTDIALLGLIFLFLRFFAREPLRLWGLFVISILSVFWLQPLSPIRYLDFWLPTITLLLIAFSWVLVTPAEKRLEQVNLLAIGILLSTVIVVSLTRFLSLEGIVTASRPPQFIQVVLVVVLAVGGMSFLIYRQFRSQHLVVAAIIFLLALFVILKLGPLAFWFSKNLRMLMSQSIENSAASDLRWLGYSYIAFRLIHVLRDSSNRRFLPVSLVEFVVYTLFPPALAAGPIDRLERFVADLRSPVGVLSENLTEAGTRISLGLFKKFVLADLLSSMSLNPVNALQVHSTPWLWLVLYAYAFQIYLDFSGYTDIAVGLGLLLGIRLPENFNHPYLRSNLAQFWNNWHMTLTQWVRAYVFNPLTRALRTGSYSWPAGVVLLIGQLVTMLLIGVWHGITWNFALWGLWHAAGLFLQNRWSQLIRPVWETLSQRPVPGKLLTVFNVLLTFHFVTLGWVWFVLPDPATAGAIFLRLLGIWQ